MYAYKYRHGDPLPLPPSGTNVKNPQKYFRPNMDDQNYVNNLIYFMEHLKHNGESWVWKMFTRSWRIDRPEASEYTSPEVWKEVDEFLDVYDNVQRFDTHLTFNAVMVYTLKDGNMTREDNKFEVCIMGNPDPEDGSDGDVYLHLERHDARVLLLSMIGDAFGSYNDTFV